MTGIWGARRGILHWAGSGLGPGARPPSATRRRRPCGSPARRPAAPRAGSVVGNRQGATECGSLLKKTFRFDTSLRDRVCPQAGFQTPPGACGRPRDVSPGPAAHQQPLSAGKVPGTSGLAEPRSQLSACAPRERGRTRVTAHRASGSQVSLREPSATRLLRGQDEARG